MNAKGQLTKLSVKSTGDIELEGLARSLAALGRSVPIEIDSRQALFKSLAAPSYIRFLQDPAFWTETLVGGLAIEVAKYAIKKTWQSRFVFRSKVLEGRDAALRAFAETLAILRNSHGAETELSIGLPIPDDWFSTVLRLEGAEAGQFAPQVALFLAHLPELDRLMRTDLTDVAGQVTLTLTDQGGMNVRWQEGKTLAVRTKTLPPPNVA